MGKVKKEKISFHKFVIKIIEFFTAHQENFYDSRRLLYTEDNNVNKMYSVDTYTYIL